MPKKNGNGLSKDIEMSVLKNSEFTRDQLKERLCHDLEGVFVFVRDLLATHDAVEALTEAYWQRYQKYHEELKKKTPTLFDENEAKEEQVNGR